MKAIVVGCGRVGAKWPGAFHVGHGMDAGVLEGAGIADADLVLVATDGDNTNLVVAQIAKLRYDVPKVAVRVQDPARAAFYSNRGFDVVSTTTTAIEELAKLALGEDGGR